jgi:hypothetical protein
MTILFTLVLQLAAAVASLVAPNADHHYPVCEASADGIVWQYATDDDWGCDALPGMIVGLTGTHGPAECADQGGTYTPYTDLDPADGWDDSEYGDCVAIDF